MGNTTGKIRIAALISGGGSNLQAIIDACDRGTINAEVVVAGADRPSAKGLERCHRHGIPTFVVDYRSIVRCFEQDPAGMPLPPDADVQAVLARQTLLSDGMPMEKRLAFIATRILAEARLLAQLRSHAPDLLVLAGFMRTLTPYFIDRINTDAARPRIMNIHPALLPAFPGTDGYADTFRHGCKVGGCTVHFIDYGEDSGPIIGQRAFAITPEDTLDTVREKGLAQEWLLYPECIQLYAENRLRKRQMSHRLPDGRQSTRSVVDILPGPS